MKERNEEWGRWHERTERKIVERRRLDSPNKKVSMMRCFPFCLCVNVRAGVLLRPPRSPRVLGSCVSGFKWGTVWPHFRSLHTMDHWQQNAECTAVHPHNCPVCTVCTYCMISNLKPLRTAGDYYGPITQGVALGMIRVCPHCVKYVWVTII